MKIKDHFTICTVRKKILMISKLAGIALILSYLISTHLPLDTDISFWIWFSFIILLVLIVDFLMGRFISYPIAKLSHAARQMADLNFSSPCAVRTNDEFGELSASLNSMAENLQQALTGDILPPP